MAKVLNPTTGQLEELYVKALDSMPVGSVIEFTGSSADVPTGWEEVNDYSTTEMNTGKKWIDGKIIYRKVLSVNSPSSTSVNTNIGSIGTFDTLVSITGNVYLNETYGLVPIPQALGTTNMVYLFIQNKATGNIMMQVQNNAYVSRPTIIIVEYTKTS